MEYTLKHITTEQELDAALLLETKVFGVPCEQKSPAYARERWLERMNTHADLMLYAEEAQEVVGIVFGRVETNGSITVGPVAVDEGARKSGVARALMMLLEERALERGIHELNLGAVEAAEGFYEKLGYTGVLLIQSEVHSIEELLSLNTKYEVLGTRMHEGTVCQVFLALSAADRELQRMYESAFVGCHTLMVYGKKI